MSRDDYDDELLRLAEMSEDDFARELLGSLDDDRPEAPAALPDRTIRKVQAELTSRDLVDLTTFVFLMRFCAPLLDLLAAFFGHDPLSTTRTAGETRNDRSAGRSEERRDRDE